MKKLWNLVDRTSWMAERKYRVCVWVLAVVGALLGAVLWLAVSRVALGTPDWLLVFAGTPALLAPSPYSSTAAAIPSEGRHIT